MKRLFYALITVFVLLAVGVQSANADGTTQRAAADTAVGNILSSYQSSTGLFSTSCPAGQQSGNCWWWTADTFMALIDYAENNANTTDATRQQYITEIKNHLQTTFNIWCNSNCPSGDDDETVSPFDNHWFDDMGWWEQAFLNAYMWLGYNEYKRAAEQLWNNVTDQGYMEDCNLIVQQNADSSKPEYEDGFANSLYVRDSAWLYEITGFPKYMIGKSDGKGGALKVAGSIRSEMIYKITGGTIGVDSSARFLIAGRADTPSCTEAGTQYWLSTQGEMVNAYADLSVAEAQYCLANGGNCVNPTYYSNMADELATTVTTNSGWTSPPTIDTGTPAILSEPCISNGWPYGCDVGGGNGINSYSSFLIFKGNFERGAYCSDHDNSDADLKTFIANNANAIAAEPHDGFLWQPNSDTNVSFGTQASMLDGLEAAIGGSHLMCAGGTS